MLLKIVVDEVTQDITFYFKFKGVNSLPMSAREFKEGSYTWKIVREIEDAIIDYNSEEANEYKNPLD